MAQEQSLPWNELYPSPAHTQLLIRALSLPHTEPLGQMLDHNNGPGQWRASTTPHTAHLFTPVGKGTGEWHSRIRQCCSMECSQPTLKELKLLCLFLAGFPMCPKPCTETLMDSCRGESVCVCAQDHYFQMPTRNLIFLFL